MYARLVRFTLQNGKESVAIDLARDLVPTIHQQPGCQAVSCFGDSESGQYYLYVLWSSEEAANAAARVIAPRLERHLAGNTVAPPERQLYPVIESACSISTQRSPHTPNRQEHAPRESTMIGAGR